MKLLVSSPKAVTVADIICDEHLELVNLDHVLAHVSQGGILDIEFNVESGRGYQVAQWPIGQSLQEDGRIYLDAMFSPVRNVTCNVDKTRVGKDIDFDKMTLEITTNGAITPVDALNYAVSVLRTQLENFLSGAEIPFNEISGQENVTSVVDSADFEDFGLKGISLELLMKPIEELEFSARAHNCLVNADIRRVIDLVNFTEDEGLKIKNFGRKSLDEVKEILRSLGLRLGMDIKEDVVIKALQKQSK
jgi:DNA-directed RNA polymerase subunit alpha